MAKQAPGVGAAQRELAAHQPPGDPADPLAARGSFDHRFVAAARLVGNATSFGGLHTTADRRARWGDAVSPAFIRLSVGCEPYGELEAAILAALQG